MNSAPIVLFVYNRPKHLKRTIDALIQNVGAEGSDLIVFSDAAASAAESGKVARVREIAHSIEGFNRIRIIERKHNLGLAKSVIEGVAKIVDEYGKVIVLEDDMVTSPYFLQFMNQSLDLYEEDPHVISAHGYVYPVNADLPETFFLKGADCWGWATWKRGWDLFEADGRKLLADLEAMGLVKRFDFNGSFPYMKMLSEQVGGRNDSWAVRWYASALVNGKMTLYPGHSLVQNIGIDTSGVHCGTTDAYQCALADRPVDVKKQPVVEDAKALSTFENYFRSINPSLLRRMLDLMKPKKG